MPNYYWYMNAYQWNSARVCVCEHVHAPVCYICNETEIKILKTTFFMFCKSVASKIRRSVRMKEFTMYILLCKACRILIWSTVVSGKKCHHHFRSDSHIKLAQCHHAEQSVSCGNKDTS